MTASTADLESTFAFVDFAGSTAVTDAHGDREAIALLHAFWERVEEVLGPDDELAHSIGDAVMLRFATPASAVTALHALLGRVIETPAVALLPRAGAHHGRAIAVEGHHYGAAVHVASRVAGLARPGQLLVTGDVALAAQALGSVTIHLGTRELRNISKPIDVWEVRLDADPDLSLDVVDEI